MPLHDWNNLVGIRRQALTVGANLPVMRLDLTTQNSIPVDLESTYQPAVALAYLT